MDRFKLNRKMTLILALAACLAANSAMAMGDASRTDPGEDPSNPPPTSGDPDLPVGPSKSTRGKAPRGSAIREGSPMGGGLVLQDAWVLRLRVLMGSLRAFYIRF